MRTSILLLFLTLPVWPQATCPAGDTSGAGSSWNGWGADTANTRYQANSGLDASQVPKLELKWAFGIPGARATIAQPSVVGQRIYIGSDTGDVYALDKNSGCVHWTFKAETGVRSAITVAGGSAFFGDQRGAVYAVKAATGEQIWRVKADDHPTARITGAPVFFEDRLYVPISSGEEGTGGGAAYQCCTFRGSVVALAADTGRQIWKTYVIQDAPKQTGAKANGTPTFGPSGAGIWSPPTIDPKRRSLYVGTGDAYSKPADRATDAIVAIDLDSGKIKWIAQDTANDVWLSACMRPGAVEDCGPDHDFGSPPILKTIGDRDLLIAGQKSGNVWAHDPDTGKVVWRTPLVANTTEFGGKIIWGGAADNTQAYFGIGPGGIGAVQLRDGELKWFTKLDPAPGMTTHPGHDGPVTAIAGVIFSGGWDGTLRALSTTDGRVVWEYNTAREFQTVNGVAGKGGSMGAPGPVVADGRLYISSGYVGVKNGAPGNVLLVFGP